MHLNPLEQITNTLLLNASFIDNIGLMNGKMGIAISFYHLARKTGNKIYEDYAGELIDEIYEEITANTPVDFENGLAGIGWGIEYLVQNGFIEADTDEVLEEFDNRLFKELIYNTPKEIGLLNGLVGIGMYLLKRIQNPQANDEKITTLTNKHTLIHLIDELDRRAQYVSELIIEPQTVNFEPKSPDHKPQTTIHKTFDLMWDYPVLLWFLAELHTQNIINFKVEKILERIVAPLFNNNNFPSLHSNQLLLALALTKLYQTIGTKETTLKISPPPNTLNPPQTFQTILNTIITGINRDTVLSELPANNTTCRHGTAGIAMVYKQLHEYTVQEKFAREYQYWLKKTNDNPIPENSLMAAYISENESMEFGLLVGFVGQIFVSESLHFLETITKQAFIYGRD